MADTAAPTRGQSGGNGLRRPRRQYGPRRMGEQSDPDSVQQVSNREESHGQRPGQVRGGRAARNTPAVRRMRDPALPAAAAPNEGRPSTSRGGSTQQRRGRGGYRRGPRQSNNSTRLIQGRQFGGQITVDDEVSETASTATRDEGELQPNAPEFVPGQPVVGRAPRQAPMVPQQRKRRASRSTAPDIATRIHEDIDNGQYECAVCTNEVLRNSKIWYCRTCWTVFHSSCIKKWSKSEGAKVAHRRQENIDSDAPVQWRCPGCNLPQEEFPNVFTCWCGKETDPRSLPGLPPFSCGQTCSRPHVLPKSCPHPCSKVCHAGACPPCPQTGPTQSCFCGRQSVTKRCVDTDYEHGWSCGQVCGETLPCGEHVCERPCHEGLCGACEVRLDARCYCGQLQKQMLCCDRAEGKESSHAHHDESGNTDIEQWVGVFECNRSCGRLFDCGKHRCEQLCHPQDPEAAHCPRSPDVVTHCPCGKTKLDDITSKQRTSCSDPITACAKSCGKTLPCGHACKQVCHSGSCPPCLAKVEVACRCGRTKTWTVCHQGKDEPPECMRICRVALNCGRHECGEHCCPGESKATARQAARRKPRPLTASTQSLDDGFEAEHICTRVCGRPLKCGSHSCPELCHKGICNTCREAIFEEISCHCGRTVLQPPLPCGTRPPPCRFECERPKACGHPQVSHTCHLDNERCPKCPFLTTKSCLCSRNKLKNQPCWLVDVRCGEICGKKLKCGFHTCRKACHRPGDCEDAGIGCRQACSKEKSCSHPCSDLCHSPYPCKEDKPCQHKILITCTCQRIKQEAKCNATKITEGNVTKSLKCDDECGRLERNRRLALALNIDADSHKDDHIPYSAETLNMYLENTQWAQGQEKVLRAFAANPDEKRLRFKPMKNHERAFLHVLAEDFGFDSESMDPEPHRHVAIFKTPRFVMAPMKTLAECARIRQVQRALTTEATNAAALEASKQKRTASNLVGDPFNAFLITDARFGLTETELRSAIQPLLSNAVTHHFDISFLPTEGQVVIQLTHNDLPHRQPTTEQAIEETLTNLKPALHRVLAAQNLGKLQLCRTDNHLNISRRESDSTTSGWSQVAAKAASSGTARFAPQAPRPEPLPARNNFTVLGTTAAAKRRQEEKREQERRQKEKRKSFEQDAQEDWWVAEEREEERERIASGAQSEVESAGPSSVRSSVVVAEEAAAAVLKGDGVGE